MQLNKKIVLVGMMGSGKSTIGYLLSKKLGLKFIDTDPVSYTHLTLPTKA